MKFQNKLILAFAATVIVVVTVIGLLQYLSTNHLLSRLSDDNVALLSKQQEARAVSLNDAIQFSIQRFLERGQMEVFSEVPKLQQQVEGFKEFSLYNQKGLVTYSSDKAALKRPIDPDLKARLYQSPEKLVRETNEIIEIYQPVVTVKSCLECHDDQKAGTVCAVSVCRLSTEATATMKRQCKQGAEQISQAGLANSLVTVLAGGVFAVVIAFLVARSIARPILHVADDLSASSRQTAAAAAQLGSAGNSLVDTASEQAAASEECAASVSEMREQARKSNQLTDGASEMMKENLRKSGDSLRAIVDINQRMSEMQADSGEMRKIMKSIDEIAFQTNILALNAAVEAARAGEAGTGFAVVAEEVRALAMRSADAAKSTQKLLDNMAHRISDGAVATKGINDNFEAIVETATAMGDRIEKITSTGREVLSGLEQVTKASEQGAQASQRVAAISEETGAASEELNAQARATAEIVSRLNAIIHGHDTHRENPGFNSGSAPTPPVGKSLDRSRGRSAANGHGGPKAVDRKVSPETAFMS